MVARPLGDPLEVAFKNLLDRAMAEDFFGRFGDSFLVLMKPASYEVVRPTTNVVQQLWTSLISQHVDFVICERRSLRPAVAYFIWAGEGRPPGRFEDQEDFKASGLQEKLTKDRWEQWIAAGILYSSGVGVYHVSREDLVSWLEYPELVLDPLEADLERYLERVVMQEAGAA